MQRVFWRLAVFVLLIWCMPVVGCDDDGDSDDDDASGVDGASLTHAGDIQPIWDARCGGCHLTSSQAGLNLTDGYGELVDVPSTQSNLDRVEPGNADASYLWHKLEGTQADVGGTGSRMPVGQSLTDLQMETIEAWITAGAVQ